jgi:phosphatidylinositol glycan class B
LKNYSLFLLSILVYILFAVFSEDYFYPDEHFQIIEFASYKLGITPKEHLSWEFIYKMRPSIQVWFVFMLFKAFVFLGVENPFYLAMILRFIIGTVSFITFYKLYKFYKNRFNLNSNTFLFISLCFVIFSFFGVRFSSETFSMLILIWIILVYYGNLKYKFFIIGILLGILFFVKFQMAILIFPIFILLIYSQFKEIKWVVLGGLISLIFNFIIDSLFYNQFTFSFYNYFYQNLILKKSEVFGSEPFYYYFIALFIVLIPFVSLTWIYIFKKSLQFEFTKILTFLFVFFIIINSFISHKEFRFLIPVLFILPFLFVNVYENEKRLWIKKTIKIIGALYLIINILLLSSFIVPLRFKMPLYKEIYRLTIQDPNSKFYYIGKNPYLLSQQIKPDIYFSFYKKKNLIINDFNGIRIDNQKKYVIKEEIKDEKIIKINGVTYQKKYQNISNFILRLIPKKEVNNLDKYTIYESL